MTRQQFADWLSNEVEQRGWSYNELARRSGLSSGGISQVVTGKNLPGPDFCLAVARGLNLPPEFVFRQAGLLPPLPRDEEDLCRLVELGRLLSSSDRETVLAMMAGLVEIRGREQR